MKHIGKCSTAICLPNAIHFWDKQKPLDWLGSGQFQAAVAAGQREF